MSDRVPAISVLMPVYNCEPFLDEAIRSIREQTFTDFEFVIVNDGSTDGSLHTIRRHAAEDPRIVVLDRPNGGIVDALNAGLAVCRGEFVARMDGDDIAMQERFALQREHLVQNPSCGAVGTNVQTFSEAGSRNPEDAPSPSTHEQIVAYMLSQAWSGLIHPTLMARREVLLTVHGYESRFEYAEDLDLLLRLSQVTTLANLPNTLLRYRRHSGSVGSSRTAQQARSAYLAVKRAARRGARVSGRELALHAYRACWTSVEDRHRLTALLFAIRSILDAPGCSVGYRGAAKTLLSLVGLPQQRLSRFNTVVTAPRR